MGNRNLTILEAIQRGRWVFRASLLQIEGGLDSIMLVIYNLKNRDKLAFRFFSTDEQAAAFVDECAAGKHGDVLDDYGERKT